MQTIGELLYVIKGVYYVQALANPFTDKATAFNAVQEIFPGQIPKGVKFSVFNNNVYKLYIYDGLADHNIDNFIETNPALTAQEPLTISNNKISIPAATASTDGTGGNSGYLSAIDKEKLDNFINIVEDGAGFVNSLMQVIGVAGSGSGASSEEITTLKSRIARLENILGDLMASDPSDDAVFEITD